MPPPSDDRSTTRGPYAKGIARRQEILDRALEVFAQRGSDRTSLRAIAKEVGVTHAALTHYFGSLEELLVAVYRESESRADDHDAPTPLTTPVELMHAWTKRNREVPGLVQLYTSLVASALEQDHPAATEFATSRFARARTDIAEWARASQREGVLRDDVDPDAVAALVVAASDGLQTQWLLDDRLDENHALHLLDRLLRVPGGSPQGPTTAGG